MAKQNGHKLDCKKNSIDRKMVHVARNEASICAHEIKCTKLLCESTGLQECSTRMQTWAELRGETTKQ